VDEHGALLPALAEGLKYEIICKEAWDLFVDWYVALREVDPLQPLTLLLKVWPGQLYIAPRDHLRGPGKNKAG
jgi:hypothetical protein